MTCVLLVVGRRQGLNRPRTHRDGQIGTLKEIRNGRGKEHENSLAECLAAGVKFQRKGPSAFEGLFGLIVGISLLSQPY